MHKIDGPGATVTFEWTEGNPAGGIPATTITDDFMNTIQREIIDVIETGAGDTLDKPDDTQLRQAIQTMIAGGGGGGGSNVQQSIINNQTVLDITGLSFAAANFKAGSFLFDIHRQTGTQNKQETGHAFVAWDPADTIWRLSVLSGLDDSGVTLSITAGGQVQYASNDLTGGSYSGTIRVIDVKKVPQTIT